MDLSRDARDHDTAVVHLERVAEVGARLERELAKAIVGQQRVVREILIAFLAGGHCLLRGVPGLAKTLLIKKLAEAVDLKFNRIQFTPDLMPSDILGAVETGVFEADIRAPAGRYDVRVTTDSGAVADASLTVDAEAAALSGPRTDLMGIPELTGGVAVDEAQLQPLTQHLTGLPRSSDRTVTHPLRSSWWMLFLVLVLSGEWILRRRAGLR
jgi:hypothetical protein